MVCRTEAGQSPGSKRAGLPLSRPKLRSTVLEPNYGRIRWADTGTCLWACMKAFADMSTFDWVDNVVPK